MSGVHWGLAGSVGSGLAGYRGIRGQWKADRGMQYQGVLSGV